MQNNPLNINKIIYNDKNFTPNTTRIAFKFDIFIDTSLGSCPSFVILNLYL